MPQTLLEKLSKQKLPENEHRLEQAKIIKEYSENFKICEGCQSVHLEIVDICPVCEGYKFDCNPVHVEQWAEILGNRPRETFVPADLD